MRAWQAAWFYSGPEVEVKDHEPPRAITRGVDEVVLRGADPVKWLVTPDMRSGRPHG